MFGWRHLSPPDRERITRGIERARAYGGPFHLEIHPTGRCNLDCFFCSARAHRAARDIEWPLLARTLERAARADLRSVRLTGGGESLVYAHIGDLLDLLSRLHVRIDDLTTNALAIEPLARRIVETGIDNLSVSLNEATPEAYARAMQVPASTFDRALRAIDAFNEARRDTAPDARPALHLKFFLWKENFRDLPRMIELADRTEADSIQINAIQGLDPHRRIGAGDPHEVREACDLVGPIVQAEARRTPLRLGVNLGEEPALGEFALRIFYEALPPSVQPMPGVIDDPRRVEFCYMGWYSATISSDGAVYPCCNFVGQPDKVVGNLHEAGLDAIWQGPPMQRMRREFRNLALLGGHMEHSCRTQRFTEPTCIARRQCPMAYYLCDAPFYRDTARRLGSPRHAARRVWAQSQDGWLRAVRRALQAVRRALT